MFIFTNYKCKKCKNNCVLNNVLKEAEEIDPSMVIYEPGSTKAIYQRNIEDLNDFADAQSLRKQITSDSSLTSAEQQSLLRQIEEKFPPTN